MPEDTFDERTAETYEAKWPELFDPAVVNPVVDFLADLAGSGAALELGIGTGRIALPLSRRGVPVHGIELSPAMVARLRAAPGSENIGVTIGDPELRRLPPGQTVHPFTVTPEHLGFEEYDVATQIAYSHHYWVVDGQLETRSTPHRYVWPAELDLMARLAGMTLHERWAGWNREPFTGESRSHVSVWRKT
ncbi:methyltransferase family protein [Nonomuraea polychroma]|uniref:Methyltransferase family protein n=1 Tax=Nonomuraea polychroma TaxID=46176 RepID=A0A438MI42_9ACTN|nr:class I SAM-dependent methyltransferase [Nonomuraea polychroma]RVX45559.1 methyltransferase family protein [Nonomuraea polychroma]